MNTIKTDNEIKELEPFKYKVGLVLEGIQLRGSALEDEIKNTEKKLSELRRSVAILREQLEENKRTEETLRKTHIDVAWSMLCVDRKSKSKPLPPEPKPKAEE